MTNGETPGTSGGLRGTRGGRIDWIPLAVIASVTAVVTIINVTSYLIDASASGQPIDLGGPVVWEITSAIMIIGLAPVVGWIMTQAPPTPSRWLRFIAIQVPAATAYSLAHVAGMVLLRKLAYAAVGEAYTFAYNNDLALPLVYEWRKDVLTYAAQGIFYWGWGYWLAQQAAQKVMAQPPGADRIEIRDGTRTILIEPADIAWLEAAGNYVEIHAGGASHLARGTLAAFEEKLAGRGFVRVHRSRLVNRKRVTAFKPTPSGDLEITLDDGRTIAGSRRYRAGMESA